MRKGARESLRHRKIAFTLVTCALAASKVRYGQKLNGGQMKLSLCLNSRFFERLGRMETPKHSTKKG